MSEATKRSIVRWMHIILGLPIISYIYGRPSDVQTYASSVRYIFIPSLVLSGLWLWKGHLLRRLIWKR